MVTVGIDSNSLQADSQPTSDGLVWQLATTWHSVNIHHMNWVMTTLLY